MGTWISDHSSKIVICYKQKGRTIDVIKRFACLAVNPIEADHFAYHFNYNTIQYNTTQYNILFSIK